MSQEKNDWEKLDLKKFITEPEKEKKKVGRPTKAEAKRKKEEGLEKAKDLKLCKCCGSCRFSVSVGEQTRLFCYFPRKTASGLSTQTYSFKMTTKEKNQVALAKGYRPVHGFTYCNNWEQASTARILKIAAWVGVKELKGVFDENGYVKNIDPKQ